MRQVCLRHVSRFQFPAVGGGRVVCRALLLTVACGLLAGCANSDRPLAEAPPLATPAPAAQSETSQSQKLSPPTLSDVQAAVRRVFKDAAVLDPGRVPAFVAGDFNGDQSPDVAVILMPVVEKLAELNEDFPNWILRDPFASTEARGPRLRVSANETLLAVIHGYGPNGWRDPQATQTFLLKNSVGSGLQARPGKEALANSPSKKVPRLRGDVIGEELGSASGYLYFAGAGYSWYDPKTFHGDEPAGMVHSAPKEIVTK